MRITTVLNLKGGVGKTTTAINLAGALAIGHRRRVLLIDADYQCNLTDFFLSEQPEYNTLAELLAGQAPATIHDVIRPTLIQGLDIIPGSDALMDLDLTRLTQGEVRVDAIRTLAERVAGQYTDIIIDCPPALSAATAAALMAADGVVIPVKLDAFGLRGLANIVRQVDNMQSINPNLRVDGVLITMYQKTEAAEKAESELRSKLTVYETRIRRTTKVDDMTYAQQPLWVYSPRSAAGVDYRRWVSEWIQRQEVVGE